MTCHWSKHDVPNYWHYLSLSHEHAGTRMFWERKALFLCLLSQFLENLMNCHKLSARTFLDLTFCNYGIECLDRLTQNVIQELFNIKWLEFNKQQQQRETIFLTKKKHFFDQNNETFFTTAQQKILFWYFCTQCLEYRVNIIMIRLVNCSVFGT